MNKKDLEDLKLKSKTNAEIGDELKNKLYKSCFFKSLIIVSVCIILLIISLFNNQKIFHFSLLFGEFLGNFSYIGISLYYIFIFSLIVFYTFFAVFTFYQRKKTSNWYKKPYLLYSYSDIPAFVAKVGLIVSFIAIFIFTPCNVSGSSMNETLNDMDKVVLWNIGYKPERNDIVVFDAKQFAGEEIFFIKRVQGIAGNTVTYEAISENKGKMFVDNDFIEEVSIGEWNNMNGDLAATIHSFVIPQGYLLVIGDNRNPGASYDSRAYGLISSSLVYGKAILRLFPFDKMLIL